ncbi:MAG: carbohydrate-binding protein [Prevotellaceae bacterium]|nr:carbohydrate-binding protein [Prevotellaceae bacterium]
MKKYINILIIAVLFASCKDMNDNIEEYLNRGEINYIGRADSVIAANGFGRVQLKWLVNDDPRITNATIYWNNRENIEQSKDFPIDRSALVNGYASVILELEEGTYVFKIVHTGDKGYPSIATEVSGRSYGEQALASVRNNIIGSATQLGNGLLLVWSNTTGISCEVSYINKNNVEVSRTYTDFTQTPIIDDFKSDLEYSMSLKLDDNDLEPVVVSAAYPVDVKAYTLSADAPCVIPITDFDLGGEGIGYHDNDAGNSGGVNYRQSFGDKLSDGVDLEGNPPNIGYTNAGEWLQYTVQVKDAGIYLADLMLSANSSNPTLSFLVDGKNATGAVPVQNDGSWSDFKWTFETRPNGPQPELYLTAGEHVIRFYENTGGYNVRGLKFTKISKSLPVRDEILSDIVGRWEFDDPANFGKATLGSDLTAVGTGFAPVEGRASGDGAVTIGMGSHYLCNHGIAANGGGTKVNEYTLELVIKFAPANYLALYQTTVTNDDDGDLFIRGNDGRIGIGDIGYSSEGSVPANTWSRVILSVNANSYNIHVNGEFVHSSAISADSRFALDPNGVLLFADEDGEDAPISVSKVAIWNRALTPLEVAALGGLN